ncbi:hypothetical protein ACFVYR_00910 [Streptomyces sp. NPDC058284]|uniref:hypothetical protein n=1 Tax=unclassified Streptomyces TaxID=2593676 RepID=UPI00365D7B9D
MPKTAATIPNAKRTESDGSSHRAVGEVLASEIDDLNHSRDVAPNPVMAFEALTAEYGLRVVEWDLSTMDPKLRESYVAHFVEQQGDRVFVVPIGQDPHLRLSALNQVITHLEVAQV